MQSPSFGTLIARARFNFPLLFYAKRLEFFITHLGCIVTTKDLAVIQRRLEDLPTLVDSLRAHISSVESRMAALKQTGLIYAKPHWREDRYFMLVPPMANGHRPNPTYIGIDPTKIKAATDGIARANEYDELMQVVEVYSNKVADALRITVELERVLTYRLPSK